MAQIPEPLKAENRELGGQARASADAITTSAIAGNSRLVRGLTNPHPPQFSKHFIDISSLGVSNVFAQPIRFRTYGSYPKAQQYPG
jgi:hypothetical protein